MADIKLIETWKKQIAAYKEKYESLYPGNRPSEKLIASFCRIYGIPWPLPLPEPEPELDPEEDIEWDFLL